MKSIPQLVLVMGVPGSGKTTLSRELVRALGVFYLDNNQIADAFFQDTRRAAEYRELRRGIYDALYAITEVNLSFGNSVLLDVPHVTHMQSEEWRANIHDLVHRTKSVLRIIRCFCSEAVLRERITFRDERRDDWKLHNWEEFLSKEPIMVEIPFDHLDVDTELSLQHNSAAAVRYLDA